MSRIIPSFLVVASAAAFVSCGGPNSQTGAVIGALGGAAAGGIIGHQSGRGLEGAAIGGALGGVGGAVVGDAQDKRNAQYYRDRDGRYYENQRPYYRDDRYYRGY
jgi:outer membrane lipoprotein SlyB